MNCIDWPSGSLYELDWSDHYMNWIGCHLDHCMSYLDHYMNWIDWSSGSLNELDTVHLDHCMNWLEWLFGSLYELDHVDRVPIRITE